MRTSSVANSADGDETVPLVVPRVLARADLVFWDFDGVIKESVGVKTEGFMGLVRDAGQDVVDRVRAHHEANGGMSRFDKIPMYLAWAGQSVDEDAVRVACNEFSQTVYQMVINAPWVPGVREYLMEDPHDQVFVLVSATPDTELKSIVADLGLRHCFVSVHGSPVGKAEVISTMLESGRWTANQAIVVGDSHTDRQAAAVNGVPFLFRKNGLDCRIVIDHSGPSFGDLIHG